LPKPAARPVISDGRLAKLGRLNLGTSSAAQSATPFG
jgi:hypothetical protein